MDIIRCEVENNLFKKRERCGGESNGASGCNQNGMRNMKDNSDNYIIMKMMCDIYQK